MAELSDDVVAYEITCTPDDPLAAITDQAFTATSPDLPGSQILIIKNGASE